VAATSEGGSNRAPALCSGHLGAAYLVLEAWRSPAEDVVDMIVVVLVDLDALRRF
jgi:hypothetical protein